MIKKLSKLFKLNDTKQADKINELVDAVNNGGSGGGENISCIELTQDCFDTPIDIQEFFNKGIASSTLNQKGISKIEDILGKTTSEKVNYLKQHIVTLYINILDDIVQILASSSGIIITVEGAYILNFIGPGDPYPTCIVISYFNNNVQLMMGMLDIKQPTTD